MDKNELELKELNLKISELEFKVKDLASPYYTKVSFWTNVVTIMIAFIGIVGQSILSNIKAESAKLEMMNANNQKKSADSLKTIIRDSINMYRDSINILAVQEIQMKSNLKKMSVAYSSVLGIYAYDSTCFTSKKKKEQSIVTKTTKDISGIINKYNSEKSLSDCRLKVYFLPKTESKAKEINDLLKSKGATTDYRIPKYSIEEVVHNEIVYYNETQIIYCEKVQSFLKKEGYGDFNIRISTGANATYTHFKIYVVN